MKDSIKTRQQTEYCWTKMVLSSANTILTHEEDFFLFFFWMWMSILLHQEPSPSNQNQLLSQCHPTNACVDAQLASGDPVQVWNSEQPSTNGYPSCGSNALQISILFFYNALPTCSFYMLLKSNQLFGQTVSKNLPMFHHGRQIGDHFFCVCGRHIWASMKVLAIFLASCL